MNRLSLARRTQIINCLVEGNSIRSTERMTDTHRDTSHAASKNIHRRAKVKLGHYLLDDLLDFDPNSVHNQNQKRSAWT